MSQYDDGYDDGFDIIDRWFDSVAWNNILIEAEQDDPDSLELMQTVSDDLANLIFHMQNKSGNDRVAYELKKFQKLITEFEV